MPHEDKGAESQTGEVFVKKWLGEIHDSEKREKHFRQDGEKTVKLYENRNERVNEFNILYANTETLSPALYSAIPRPVVQRRFKDEDPIGAVASKATQRVLEFLVDDGNPKYADFDSLMNHAVLSALVPGRGIIRFKYDAMIVKQEESDHEPTKKLPMLDEGEPNESIEYETVCGSLVPWNHFCHGFARVWQEVPWVAFYHSLTKEELADNFPEQAPTIAIEKLSSSLNDEDKTEGNDVEGTVEGAVVYEIWDKAAKKVYFISPNYPGGILRELDDPLQLEGFFPCPEPLTFFRPVSSMVPVSLYNFYKEQAHELNMVTNRINKICHALKVRGFYDGTIEGMDQLMSAEDNTLLPAANVAALQERQGLANAIWFFPLEKLIEVLRELYQEREQIKRVIYEIVGISDILRGASKASETAAAQQIKDKWGTMRVNRLQQQVMVYARNCLRIMAEIAVTRFGQETFAAMTGMELLTSEEKSAFQQKAMLILPSIQDEAERLQIEERLQAPSWGEILAILKDDLQRAYKIDIETNSTVSPEATEDKENIAEFMNAMSQFLLGVQPLIESGTMDFEVAKTILLTMVRKYRFGPEVEDEIKKMKAPTLPGGDPEETAKREEETAAKEQELAEKEQQLSQKEQELQAQQQKLEVDAQLKIQSLELQAQKREMQRQSEHQRLIMQMETAKFQQEMKAMRSMEQIEQAKRQAQQPRVQK